MSLSVTSIEANGMAGIRPRLDLVVGVENDWDHDVEVWGYNAKVSITCPSSSSGLQLTESAIVEDFGALQKVVPVTTARRSQQRHTLRMQVPLEWSALYGIERERAGRGGVRINLDCQVLIVYAHPVHQQVLQRQFDRLSRQGSSPVTEDVSQEKWLQILGTLGYRDYMIVEMPAQVVQSNAKLADAWKQLESAYRRFERGDDPGVLEACFKALDSIALHYGAKAGHASAFEEILKPHLLPDIKARRAGDLIHSIRTYSDRGRQAQAGANQPEVPICHRDAEYVLILTRASLAYIANILS